MYKLRLPPQLRAEEQTKVIPSPPSMPALPHEEQAPAPSRPAPRLAPAPTPGPLGDHVPGVRDYKGKPVTWATVRAVYDLEQMRRARGFGDGGDAMLERLGILEHKARVIAAEYGV